MARRRFLPRAGWASSAGPAAGAGVALVSFVVLGIAGCTDGAAGRVEAVWGRRGISDGRLMKPRAIAIDEQDQLYLVDMTGRIQVFDGDGKFLRGWRTPEIYAGKPCGLTFNRAGELMVADTHYFRVLFYTREGQLLSDRTLGGTNGPGPGEFGFVTDVAEDSQGCLYVAEYGEYDRIQKFTPEGKYLFEWGGHGSEPGQFLRPQCLAVDEQDRLWVADACNHRLQVFDATGGEAKLVQTWGVEGEAPGQMRYPYGLLLDGEYVYVCEFGNHRVQKFTRGGQSVAVWGRGGRGEGELHQPWSLAMDSRGRLFVLDSYNHRVQRMRF